MLRSREPVKVPVGANDGSEVFWLANWPEELVCAAELLVEVGGDIVVEAPGAMILEE